MADNADQSKTEDPTPRRREEARQQGQIAVSQELASALLFIAAMLAMLLNAQIMGAGLLSSVRSGLTICPRRELSIAETQMLFSWLGSLILQLIGPFLLLMFVVALGAMALQVGFHLLPGLLAFRPERLNPGEGLGRVFSITGTLSGILAVLKVSIICLVAYYVLSGRSQEVANLGRHDLATTVRLGWDITLRLALTAAVAMVVLGAADYAYKRYRLEQSLRMTKQELIDEHKREEGDPQVKARIRKLGREMSQRKMMKAVPQATVVITNPTHLAIALRYDKRTGSAPCVVAKGAGYVALRIIDVARNHAVPVVERKPVARALYKAVKVGQEIPLALYQAVAEVLTYVYRLRGTVNLDEDQGAQAG